MGDLLCQKSVPEYGVGNMDSQVGIRSLCQQFGGASDPCQWQRPPTQRLLKYVNRMRTSEKNNNGVGTGGMIPPGGGLEAEPPNMQAEISITNIV